MCVLGVVHKGRPQRGGRRSLLRCGQMRTRGEGGFDSMRTSASQLGTKACHAGMCSCSVPERQDRNWASKHVLKRGQIRIPIPENGSVSSGPTTWFHCHPLRPLLSVVGKYFEKTNLQTLCSLFPKPGGDEETLDCAQAALQPTCRGRRASWSNGYHLQRRSCYSVWC